MAEPDLSSILAETSFDPPDRDGYYSVSIGRDGVIVYSECCAERMGREVAAKVHQALSVYLAAPDARDQG